MDNIITIKSLSDGSAIANAVCLYLNSLSTPGVEFFHGMFIKDHALKHNFTMLCIEWFKALSQVSYFDERNRASVEYAREIVPVLDKYKLERRKPERNNFKNSFDFYYRSNESMISLMDGYFVKTKDNTEFVEKMLYEHRTIQQFFSGLCIQWLKFLSERDTRRHKYLVAARAIAKYDRRLPMI